MGLHLDIDRIGRDNKAKIGHRKMGFLVNDGDKLTKAGRERLQELNQEKYGLSEEELENLKLPAPTEVKIYSINKIMKSRGKLSTIEKINHLLDLKEALEEKLRQKVESRKQAKITQAAKTNQSHENPEELRTSSLSEEKSEVKVSAKDAKEDTSRKSGGREGSDRPRSSVPFKTKFVKKSDDEDE